MQFRINGTRVIESALQPTFRAKIPFVNAIMAYQFIVSRTLDRNPRTDTASAPHASRLTPHTSRLTPHASLSSSHLNTSLPHTILLGVGTRDLKKYRY